MQWRKCKCSRCNGKAVEASVAGAQKFHKSQVESETDDEGDDL